MIQPDSPQIDPPRAWTTSNLSRFRNGEDTNGDGMAVRKIGVIGNGPDSNLPNRASFPSNRAANSPKRKSKPIGAANGHDLDSYNGFRRLVDDLVSEVSQLDDFIKEGKIEDEGLGAVVEIENLLERLYDYPWGDGESLKRVVVAIQAQINNTSWYEKHLRFLQDCFRLMRVRYLVNAAFVEDILALVAPHGLDPFRGTVAEPEVLKRYRLVEVGSE